MSDAATIPILLVRCHNRAARTTWSPATSRSTTIQCTDVLDMVPQRNARQRLWLLRSSLCTTLVLDLICIFTGNASRPLLKKFRSIQTMLQLILGTETRKLWVIWVLVVIGLTCRSFVSVVVALQLIRAKWKEMTADQSLNDNVREGTAG